MTVLTIFLLLLGFAGACAAGYWVARAWGVAVAVLVVGAGIAAVSIAVGPMEQIAVGYVVAFGLPIFLVAGAMGVFSGKMVRSRQYGLAASPFLALAAYAAYLGANASSSRAERAQVLEFMLDHPQLGSLMIENAVAGLSSSTYQRGATGWHTFSLQTKKPTWAIVRADRKWFSPTVLRLECVSTEQYGSHRCARTVPLGDERLTR